MTVTSNIHVGLAAWSNHSFALNECCSNAGNAYRCTTSGSSTAAPTGTGSSINNGGTAVFKWLSTAGASDYSTIAAWMTSIPGGTLSQPYIGLIWNDGATAITLTAALTFTGHTATATNNITLKCAAGESFADNPNSASNPLYPSANYGVLLALNLQYGTLLTNSDDYSVFDGLQFTTAPPATNWSQGWIFNNISTITRCILIWKNASNANGVWSGTGGTGLVAFANCVMLDQQAAGANNAGVRLTHTTVNMTNCILHSLNGSTNTGIVALYGDAGITITNTSIFGYSTFSNTTWATKNARNNLTDVASYLSGWTDTGAATLFSKTAANQFVGVGTDYKLKTGADAINAGFADTTHIPSATDVYGTSRPQGAAWDIGPHEMVSAGPPPYRARVVRWG